MEGSRGHFTWLGHICVEELTLALDVALGTDLGVAEARIELVLVAAGNGGGFGTLRFGLRRPHMLSYSPYEYCEIENTQLVHQRSMYDPN